LSRGASPNVVRYARALAAAALLAAPIVPDAAAQQPDPGSPAAPGRTLQRPGPALIDSAIANRVGLCQCIADLSSLQMRCMPSERACLAACGGTTFSFRPLIQDALRVCPPREVYVVLPNADGRPGAGTIEVGDGNSTVALNQAYAAVAALGTGGTASMPLAERETQTLFASAIAARPKLPSRFSLYFDLGSDRMMAQSFDQYRNAVADIKSRPVYEVEVTGHTDTVAGDAVNQKLSEGRAQAVRRLLIRDGIDERAVAITGRGKRTLLVPTRDEVSEQRNRRVEISVR